MDVQVVENERVLVLWARQFKAAAATTRDFVTVATTGAESAVREASIAAITGAAQRAGGEGRVILAVGHGGSGGSDSRVGMLDLAPRQALRLQNEHVFYTDERRGSDDTITRRVSEMPRGTCGRMARYRDLESAPEPDRFTWVDCRAAPGIEVRRTIRAGYERVAAAFRTHRPGSVVLLCCEVGSASAFVQRVCNDWGVPVQAYGRQVAFWEDDERRARAYLYDDQPGQGTNRERARTETPNGSQPGDVRRFTPVAPTTTPGAAPAAEGSATVGAGAR
jgi:hypothetical protein